MIFEAAEVREILRMIEQESLDIRAVTLGVSLRDCAAADAAQACRRVRDKVLARAERLAPAADEVAGELGVPITNRRVAVTPIALVAEAAGPCDPTPFAHAMEEAAAALGIDYIGGYSALIEKGMTPGDLRLCESIPEALGSTERVCASVNVAGSRAGIHMDAVALMGRVIKATAERTADRGGVGCARLVVFANVPGDNPFVAGALHGVGEGECVVNVGVSGPGVVLAALRRLRDAECRDLGAVAETVKRMAFKVTRAGELIGREVARRIGDPARFGIVDLSLAPTPAIGDSVAEILEEIGVERVGAPGSTVALALLTDAVKKGGAMASSSVGGLSGAFIPVSEDHAMAEAVAVGALTLDKLEAMSAVCSVGLDMVCIPGDTPAETIAAILADEMAIGVFTHKTTAARLIPVPGKSAGDRVEFGGLLGSAPIMPVSPFSAERLVRRGGRVPAPITSLRN